jgi:sodium/hydrogen antiporter
LLAGITFSPHATNLIRPLEYALGSEENLAYITLYFSRLVLGVQLVLAGVQLPSRYLWREWKSLALLLGPNMVVMWVCASLLIYAMVPNLPILHALACGACVTPTDPVLSNSIVKGKFADKNIPKDLQKIIIAESGANDGLGYPFLFLALYLIKYNGDGGLGQSGGTAKAMGYWFGEMWGYTILLSVIYGIAVGWIAKELLHFSEERKFVDRESFLVFAITLALFITGTCGMVGSDDVLACFVAGNVFTWDDWFRLETLDDSLQPTIDMLLNLSIFIWYGAVCPWVSFRVNDVIPLYRLVFLGILILLFRRVPSILIMHKQIWQIEHFRQALFVGFFGPIGVSAIFYLYVSIDFLDQVTFHGEQREDVARLKDVMTVVIWFLAICSIVVHGLSVPLGKLGYNIPRTISSALSTSTENVDPQNNQLRNYPYSASRQNQTGLRQRRNPQDPPPRSAFMLRGSEIPSKNNSGVQSPDEEPSRPINFESRSNTQHNTPDDSPNQSDRNLGEDGRAIVAGEEQIKGLSGGTANAERD